MEDTSGDALDYDPYTSLHINWVYHNRLRVLEEHHTLCNVMVNHHWDGRVYVE